MGALHMRFSTPSAAKRAGKSVHSERARRCEHAILPTQPQPDSDLPSSEERTPTSAHRTPITRFKLPTRRVTYGSLEVFFRRCTRGAFSPTTADMRLFAASWTVATCSCSDAHAPCPVAAPAHRRQTLITNWAAQCAGAPAVRTDRRMGCRSQPGEKRASRLLRTCSQAPGRTRAPPPVPQTTATVCRRFDEGSVPVCQLAVLSRFGSSLWRSEESIRISGYRPLCHGMIRHDREQSTHSGSRFGAHVC